MEDQVIHNMIDSRFEMEVENLLSFVDYTKDTVNNCLIVTHTFVPKSLSGRGIAAILTKTVLDYAIENGFKINPLCSYTSSYLSKHEEYGYLKINC